jgi:hypothetical protein
LAGRKKIGRRIERATLQLKIITMLLLVIALALLLAKVR